MEKRKMINGEKGFVYILFGFSLVTLYFAIQIFKKEVSFSSPGFFPVFVSSIMIITSILIWREMKKLSPSKSKNKVKETINSMLNRRIVVSIILIFIYAFLLGIVGFEISTLLFLFSIMMFLKAGKWFKVLIISSVTLGVIIVIFSTIFNVILP
ncbi:MAG TPA: hypothetical protein DHM42_04745 [Clostridiales bacterium]|jgi:hypothetical protein|nr:hypothetical protein [Clostridiales bacterium]